MALIWLVIICSSSRSIVTKIHNLEGNCKVAMYVYWIPIVVGDIALCAIIKCLVKGEVKSLTEFICTL